jgi:hypothetical protein
LVTAEAYQAIGYGRPEANERARRGERGGDEYVIERTAARSPTTSFAN